MNELENSRKTINNTDREMARLFCERMKAVRVIAGYKAKHGLPVTDEVREAEVIKRGSELVEDSELKQYYLSFIKSTMEISRAYQHRLCEGMRIAYSGVRGAFANIAAKRIFPDGVHIPFPSFSAAYRAVCDGECDCAVLPIENSYAGGVGQVTDLMFTGELFVNGVYDLEIVQNLLGVKGAAISDVKTVISHPQALTQCEGYIKEHGFKTVEERNTAVAAQLVSEKSDKTFAAVASRETAELYNLEILDHDINEANTNMTRFAVFSQTGIENKANNNSFILMFTVNNSAGSLAKAISVIGSHGFNMKALRSRPMKELAWQYYFYIEAEGNAWSGEGEIMLAELSKYCDKLKLVGTYSTEREI